MKWQNLKNNECPHCGEPLIVKGDFLVCSNDECDFMISEPKFVQIVNKLYRKRDVYQADRDNQDLLNNL